MSNTLSRLEATLQDLVTARVIEETRNMQRQIYELDTLRGDAVSALSYAEAKLRAALEREAKLRAELDALRSRAADAKWDLVP